MSGNICVATNAVEYTLAVNTPRTLLQILAPTNQIVKVKGWAVYFAGVTASYKAIDVRVIRQTGLGASPSTVTPVSQSGRTETILTTAKDTHNSTEPANSGAVVDRVAVHPQQWYEVRFPAGEEIIMPGGTYLGIECTVPSSGSGTTPARAKFIFEE